VKPLITCYTLDPLVSLLQSIALVFIILAAVAAALAAPRRLIIGLLVAIAIAHAAYLTAYIHAYNLHLTLYPFLDLLKGPRGPSFIVDFTQISIAIIALMIIVERRSATIKRESNINGTIHEK
jgi:disulfide bond formation protein DsbB